MNECMLRFLSSPCNRFWIPSFEVRHYLHLSEDVDRLTWGVIDLNGTEDLQKCFSTQVLAFSLALLFLNLPPQPDPPWIGKIQGLPGVMGAVTTSWSLRTPEESESDA